MRTLLFSLAAGDLFDNLVAQRAGYALTADEQAEHRDHFARLYDAAEDAAAAFEKAFPVTTLAAAAEINAAGKWVAGVNDHFIGWAVADVQRLLGTPTPDSDTYFALPKRDQTPAEELVDVPADFDARDKWTSCPSVSTIRDQANCGSCWAFGSTEAFNDRACIASDSKFTTLLSVQHTASCCGMLQCLSQGCGGGQPGLAWRWLTSHGVVTGGDNPDTGKSDTCWPYELKMCSHHVKSAYPPCPAEVSTPSCKSSCVNTGYATAFSDDEHSGNGGKSYSLGSIDEIKQSLFTKGPVTGAFTVYSDFPAYKSGVYTPTSTTPLGGHAIRIFGWGTEDGKDYWLVANSWNADWGDKGTFKIKMGECGIDSQVSAGDVEASMAAMMI